MSELRKASGALANRVPGLPGLYPHITSPFGMDTFGRVAEAFARAFGTPHFITVQTAVVAMWIVAGVLAGSGGFDPYPFILLNLAFSLQAAYAAPLILLAQTRAADRDSATTEAERIHRERLAHSTLEAVEHNAELSRQILEISQRVEALAAELRQERETS
jgi:uncharacterized membrane protein